MKKVIYFCLIILFLFVAGIKPIQAQEESDLFINSSHLPFFFDLAHEEMTTLSDDQRVKMLQHFFQDNYSELFPYSQLIVYLADYYSLPWSLVPAISGVESTFCKHIPYQSYNCWGWNNGKTGFANYPEALEIVSRTLRLKYYNRGADTVDEIAPIYAPPSSTWAGKVKVFMNKIENYPPSK